MINLSDMKKIIICISILLCIKLSAQDIPYNQYPDWESTTGHVATGLGIADINNDGWNDLVVANGNDIHRQHLVVYYNRGDGTFNTIPDWESEDIDYHGHLAVGDINSDGYIDVAVSVYLGPDGFGDPGKVKVYYNQNGELEANPGFESFPFYTFSCAFGDADGDGDLDLGVACGEPYGELFDKGRIFFNVDGSFSNDEIWETDINMGALDVDFGDLDDNGYLDIVFACEYTDNYIYLSNNEGNLPTMPSWNSEESPNFINSLDIAKLNNSSLPSVVMTGNNQLGGDGKIRLYSFTLPFPNAGSSSWLSGYVGYGSGVLIADVTRDEVPDLIYGGWWKAVEILEGNGVDFYLTPSYTSSETSVVETILMADLGKENLQYGSDTLIIGSRRNMVYYSRQIIDSKIDVYKNGLLLNDESYTYLPNKNWLAFNDNLLPGDELILNYLYCFDGDIVITNWDSGKGNFIYYNTNPPTGIGSDDEKVQNNSIIIYPNPASENITMQISLTKNNICKIRVNSITGILVMEQDVFELSEGINHIDIDISAFKDGIYFVSVELEDYQQLNSKFTVLK